MSVWKAVGPFLALSNPSSLLDVLLTVLALVIGIAGMYSVVLLAEAGIVVKEHAKARLGMVAILVTMLAYVVPIPIVADAIRKMNPQSLPTEVFQLQAICNVLSISYGIQVKNPAVLFTNMFGLAFQVLYLSSDHLVRVGNTSWLRFSITTSLMANCGLYVAARMSPLNALGPGIIILNLCMSAAPLAKVPNIMRTKNANALNLAMTCLNLGNNVVWTMYAFLIEDVVVLLPSLVGYLLGGFQVLVILWCRGLLPFDLAFVMVFCGGTHPHPGGKNDLQELELLTGVAVILGRQSESEM